MLKTCPNAKDVQHLQYILHCRLKVFDNKEVSTFPQYHSLVSCASRFGLIFVGTNRNALQVVQTKELENYTIKDKDVSNYKRRLVILPSVPKHICVNCDSTILAVVVHKDNCPWVVFYDVPSFYSTNIKIIHEIRLSSTSDVFVREINWNPSLPAMFTACKSDGTLGIYELTADKSMNINELPAESRSTTFCWSPKGKQIAVGDIEGKITQYKPDLKAVKIINKPTLEGDPMLILLQWVSNYQFIGVYQPKQPGGSASLVVVDAPKTGDCTFTSYDDVCYSGSVRSLPQFYAIMLHQWNLLMVASANSTELGVLGYVNGVWTQWILPDSGRAELPLGTDDLETLPIGMGFDVSATKPLPWGEATIPSCPQLMLLSHQGVLCIFNVVNLQRDAANLCTPADTINDQSGLTQFGNAEPQPQVTVPPQPQNKLLSNMFMSQNANNMTISTTLPTSTPAFSTSLFKNIPAAQPLNVSQFPLSQSSSAAAPTAKLQPIDSIASPATTSQATLVGAGIVQNLHQPPKVMVAATTGSEKQVVVENKNVPVKKVEPEIESNVISSDTEAMLNQMIREEFLYLEAELKALLHQGRGMNIDLGTDFEKTDIVTKNDALKSFAKEMEEICGVQKEEVHYLKHNLMQTWAWFEEAKSRFIASKDENIALLLRSQPLDSAAEKRLKDIHQLEHYIQSQLVQASKALDEQWDNFQDFVKKTYRVQTPTMETIFQTMVRQNAILQKQIYVLKDITLRLRKNARSSTGGNKSLLLPLDKVTAQLTGHMNKMSLTVDDVYERQYEKILNRTKALTPHKMDKLRNILKNRDAPNVTTIKPVSSTIGAHTPPNRTTRQMISLLGAQLSPVSKPPVVKSVEFVQSTPLRLDAKTPKTAEDGASGLGSAFAPTSTTKPLNFTANAPFTFNQSANKIETSKPFSFATPQKSGNFNFTSTTATTTNSATTTGISGTRPSFSFVTPLTTATALPTAPSSSFGSGFKTAPLTMMVKPDAVVRKPDVVAALPQPVIHDVKQQQVKLVGVDGVNVTNTTAATQSVQQATADSTVTKSLPMFGVSSTTPITSAPRDKLGSIFGDDNNIKSTSPSFGTISSTPSATPLFIPTPIIKPVPTSATTTLSSPADDKPPTTVSDPNRISESVSPITLIQTATAPSSATSFSFTKGLMGASAAFASTTAPPTASTTPITSTTSSGEVTTSAAPLFGVSTKASPFAAFGSSTPIFGAAPAPTNTTTTSSSNATASSGSIFGGTAKAGSIFGSSSTTATSTPIFNTDSNVKPAFGTPTSAFGNSSATTTSTSVFDTASPAKPFFGTATSAFGSGPTTTTSTSIFNAGSNANPAFGTAASTFGSSSSPTTTSTSIFHTDSNAKSAFGSATTASIFGGTSTAAPMFPASTATGSIFGGSTPAVSSTATTPSSVFGSAAPVPSNTAAMFPSASVASSSIFANAAASMASSSAAVAPFGQQQQKQETGGFGGGASIFGNAGSVFGSSNTGDGAASTATSAGIFGSVNTGNVASSGFGSGSVFGSSIASTQQQQQQQQPSGLNFGSLSVNNGSSSGSIFGEQTTVTGAPQNPFGKTDPKPAAFGSSTGSIFGGAAGAAAPTASSSIFSNANTGTSAFGASTDGTFGSQGFGSNQPNSVFGQTAFGNQPGVGQSGFGSTAAFAKPTAAFGASPTFGGGAASGFGGAPTFGGSPAYGAATAFGSNPGNVFGAGTVTSPQTGGFGSAAPATVFESLANQNTLSFGNLANQTAPPSNPAPFSGASSFSSWR